MTVSRLLVRHPAAMDRLREEISSVMENSAAPTREQIRQMPFLSCVVKESECPLHEESARIFQQCN
jgi:hypothetical protein